jgi:hypothetical protein
VWNGQAMPALCHCSVLLEALPSYQFSKEPEVGVKRQILLPSYTFLIGVEARLILESYYQNGDIHNIG